MLDSRPLRVCVDLNVWVADFLATVRGGRATASTAIVRAVQYGRSVAGPVQLIVSLTMVSRLSDVLVRKGTSPSDADQYTEQILNFARRGPAMECPHLVIAGGVQPTAESKPWFYDPYDMNIAPPRADDEDGRVLDTALAGRADVLATLNFRDFRYHQDEVIERDRIHVRVTGDHSLLVMHADRVAEWFRTGKFPGPAPVLLRFGQSGDRTDKSVSR
jgi:hypothetical protein